MELDVLQIKCNACGGEFRVEGYIIPDSQFEPGEVVTDLDCVDGLCSCLHDGGSYLILSEDHPTFEDDVL